MKTRLLLVLSLLVICVMGITGCGTTDKFSGIWVSQPELLLSGGYRCSVYTIKKTNKGYDIHFYFYNADEKKASDSKQATDFSAPDPGDSNILNAELPMGRATFAYDESSKEITTRTLTLENKEIKLKKLKDEKELQEYKDAIAKIVKEHEDEFKQYSDTIGKYSEERNKLGKKLKSYIEDFSFKK